MNRPSAGGARFWGLAFLGLGLPVCVALALIGPPGPALDAVGRLAGAALGPGPADAARLGRLANVALFLTLGLSALALAARGRAALFALLCLPASLAAASGPEGVVVALAALAAALLTPRPLTGRGRPARLAAATLAIALAVLARPACAPLAGMLLVPFPPAGRFGRFGRDRLAPAVLALLAALLPALFRTSLAAGAGGEAAPSPSWPPALSGLWALVLLVTPLALRRGPLPPPAERLWLVGCAVLGLWLAGLAQALAPAGHADGLQVRDLLPLGALLVPAFARGRIGTADSLTWPALLPVLAAAATLAALVVLIGSA
ncbi:DUF2142 domain-containing protein [Methylobacterium sp. PvR107]|uniref:DUF2142 domain-containing protein n=1 Tax=Methylobacterium sp. PvR107 TaxID=2806597 RepID=UPI001AE6E206|nr:DUF2142 domain-containing protein [Methylobacterium sp. PvR107]MBP1184134.1 hypothetical protein [Methylobacterium sp. PvR107]